jgi:hypothetical protein
MPAADPHADLPLVVRQATPPARAGMARRNPARQGGAVDLSGALIGADDDPHIPWAGIEQTAANFQAAGVKILRWSIPSIQTNWL